MTWHILQMACTISKCQVSYFQIHTFFIMRNLWFIKQKISWYFWYNETAFSYQFSSVQSLSRVRLFATPWIAAPQASLSIINSRSSLRLMSIKLVMPSSYLILCRPLLLLPPIPPSIRVFSNESTLRMRWTVWRFLIKLNLDIWSSNPTPGSIPGEYKSSNSKYIHPSVHSGTLYNGQDMETAQLPINSWSV